MYLVVLEYFEFSFFVEELGIRSWMSWVLLCQSMCDVHKHITLHIHPWLIFINKKRVAFSRWHYLTWDNETTVRIQILTPPLPHACFLTLDKPLYVFCCLNWENWSWKSPWNFPFQKVCEYQVIKIVHLHNTYPFLWNRYQWPTL